MSFRNRLRRWVHLSLLDWRSPLAWFVSREYSLASSCVWILYFEHNFEKSELVDPVAYIDIEAYDANGEPLMVVHHAGKTQIIPLQYEDFSTQKPKFPLTIERA